MGIDSKRFVDSPPSWSTCPVCLDIAGDPYTVCAAEHILCATCADKVNVPVHGGYLPPSCPTCRKPLSVKPSHVLKRILEDYKVCCVRKGQGCRWTGSLSEEEQHRNSTCLYRQIKCTLCPASFVAKNAHAHPSVCPNQVLVCPRGSVDCGGIKDNGRYKRCETALHEERCTEYACRLSSCGTRTSKRNLQRHEDGCRAHRDELSDLKQRLQDLTSENGRLKQANATPNGNAQVNLFLPAGGGRRAANVSSQPGDSSAAKRPRTS
ncbi:hypothetical protein JCM8097_001310 [Rhodosporidiobolus ruineniae]